MRSIFTLLMLAVGIPALADPATGLQTDVRRQQPERTPEWKKEKRERLERREARAAEARVVESVVVEPSAPADVQPTGEIAYIIHDIFGANGDAAVSVASCESGLDPNATNASGAAGLFQLMPSHWQGKFDPYDPVANARYAYGLSSGGTDWGAWAEVCRP